MAPASRFPQPAWIPWAAALLAVALGLALFVRNPGGRSPATVPTGAQPAAAAWKDPTTLAGSDWSLVSPAAGPAAASTGALAARFRLAGTFLEYGDETAPAHRKAVLDDTKTGVQSILGEGDALDSVLVARVFIDHVTLRSGSHEEDLWMTFARVGSSAGSASTGTLAAATGAPPEGAANRFGGQRVGENRWTFERAGLINYYRELMDQPERLVKVFDSLRPLYDDQKKITGYELHVEGEPEFFDAVGFREGDVVRKVNSMDMTNRRRAEFFIKQFVEGRSTAFVIEIERDGQAQKLVYQAR